MTLSDWTTPVLIREERHHLEIIDLFWNLPDVHRLAFQQNQFYSNTSFWFQIGAFQIFPPKIRVFFQKLWLKWITIDFMSGSKRWNHSTATQDWSTLRNQFEIKPWSLFWPRDVFFSWIDQSKLPFLNFFRIWNQLIHPTVMANHFDSPIRLFTFSKKTIFFKNEFFSNRFKNQNFAKKYKNEFFSQHEIFFKFSILDQSEGFENFPKCSWLVITLIPVSYP